MLLLPWLAFFIYSASAVLVNVTIDDTFGDPTTGNKIQYSPPSSWNLGGDCNGCSAYPSAAQAYLHTWQDGTFNKDSGSNPNPNQVLLATVPFTGTAVYVYCILALSQASPTGRSDMTFIVDNQVVGTFVNEPQPGQSGFLYNVLVYANNSLADSRHILTIQNGHTDGEKSLILLDYIIYS
ncbi:hypothetical protein C8J56DRAFT_788566 [Mycena floridula]|nr:hypothetical protein C8J56DRAFT_788566 [Mycena floridula]